jgi:septal ring factor EnvC (AmiA/AmiB activator)
VNSILLWLWRKLTAYVEGALDPESRARAKAFEAKVAALEQKEREAEELARQSEAAYLESVKDRERWDALLAESKLQEKASEERLRASQDRVKAIEDETKKLNDAVPARSDDDAFSGVPR